MIFEFCEKIFIIAVFISFWENPSNWARSCPYRSPLSVVRNY